MVTGASTADLAVILIDGRKGMLTQTRRHSYLVHLLGISKVVLAVNKMDLVDYDQARFDAIVADYTTFASSVDIETFTAIPISGFKSDNVTSPSANTPWYRGPTLMEHLETVDLGSNEAQASAFRMPVQWVNRPNLDFRGFSGLITQGQVRPGDPVRVLPSGKLKDQKPAVLWLTGLSGVGKSTIANLVEKRLAALGRHTFLLDGDNVRHGLNKDLGFTDADKVENIRRVGGVAKLMTDAGLIVITAFISPFRAERALVRALLPPGEFIEVHIDTPLADAETHDVKGLYAKARSGALQNFTGVDSPYEVPEHPEIHIDTTALTADRAAEVIVQTLLARD